MVRAVYTLVQLVHFSPVAVHQLYHQHSQIWDVMKQSVQYFTHYRKPLLGFFLDPWPVFWRHALNLPLLQTCRFTCVLLYAPDSPAGCTCFGDSPVACTCSPVQRRSQARSWVEWSEIGCGHLWGCLMPRNWEPYPSIWPLIPPDSWSPSPIAACKLASSPFVSHYNSAKSFEKNPRNSDQTVSEAF